MSELKGVISGGSLSGKISTASTNRSIDHDLALNRDLPDQHPIGAITGLEDELLNRFEDAWVEDGYLILKRGEDQLRLGPFAGGGGGGTTDYAALENKPRINGVELIGNLLTADLGLKQLQWVTYGEWNSTILKAHFNSADQLIACQVGKDRYLLTGVISGNPVFTSVSGDTVKTIVVDGSTWTQGSLTLGTYRKPTVGIPKTDLASDVQTSLGKADSAYQKPVDGVPTADIADGAVTTQKFADGSVTNAKLGQDAVKNFNISSGAVSRSNLAADAFDVFRAEYGTTYPVEIATAITDGKLPVCLYNNRVHVHVKYVPGSPDDRTSKHYFSSLDSNGTMYYIVCEIVSGTLTWSNGSIDLTSGGFGYGTCTTAEATLAKTASISSYTLTTGGIVAIKFENDVPANATLNITSKGAKAIYYKGAAITDGVIKAGDTVTMIYSTYYHVLSIDRDVDTIPPSPSNDTPIDVGNASYAGVSSDYARADHCHALDSVALENAISDLYAINIPVIMYNSSTNGVYVRKNPQNLASAYQSQIKINFTLVVPPDYNNYPVLFTPSKFDATTGELHLTGIVGGVLYEATLLPGADPTGQSSNPIMVGTMTTTNLVLPGAQGVSF